MTNSLPGHSGNLFRSNYDPSVLRKMNDKLLKDIRKEYHEVPDRKGIGRLVKVTMIPMGASGRDYEKKHIRSHTIRTRK